MSNLLYFGRRMRKLSSQMKCTPKHSSSETEQLSSQGLYSLFHTLSSNKCLHLYRQGVQVNLTQDCHTNPLWSRWLFKTSFLFSCLTPSEVMHADTLPRNHGYRCLNEQIIFLDLIMSTWDYSERRICVNLYPRLLSRLHFFSFTSFLPILIITGQNTGAVTLVFFKLMLENNLKHQEFLSLTKISQLRAIL